MKAALVAGMGTAFLHVEEMYDEFFDDDLDDRVFGKGHQSCLWRLARRTPDSIRVDQDVRVKRYHARRSHDTVHSGR